MSNLKIWVEYSTLENCCDPYTCGLSGPYGFENYVDMTETPLRAITNSGAWMLILAPTYSVKIFIGRTVVTTYIIPFVHRMLLARGSIVGIHISSSIHYRQDSLLVP